MAFQPNPDPRSKSAARREPNFGAPVRRPPGPLGKPLVGSAGEMRTKGSHQFAVENMQRYGDICFYRVLRWPIYLLNHPDYIKHVLQDNHRNYGKDTFAYRILRMTLGNGLVTSDGAEWSRQRRLTQPAFQRRRVDGFAKGMTQAALDLLTRWETFARDDRPFDLAQEMSRVTLRIAGETLFSINLTDEAHAVGQALAVGLEEMTARVSRPFSLPLSIPTRANRRFVAARKALDGVVSEIVRERRRDPGDRGDLLSMFTLAEDPESGARMSDQQLRDQVMTMMLAGHETTANALTWTLTLLARHPEPEATLRAELASVLSDRTPTLEDLPRLEYTWKVFHEALRLYPPIYTFSRTANEDDEIGGYRIPAGSIVSISPYAVHRNPAYWEDPDCFDPKRFDAEAVATRNRFTYLPFAAGPRACIGSHFAITEAQLILATILPHYRIELVEGHPIEPAALIALRPKFGIRARLVPIG